MPGRTHGRAAELERINDLLHTRFTTRSMMLLIEGPAGSGKSHLLQEAARAAERLGIQVASNSTRGPDSKDFSRIGTDTSRGLFGQWDPLLVIADDVTSITGSFMTSFRSAQTLCWPPSLWLASVQSGRARPHGQLLHVGHESNVTRIELQQLSHDAVDAMAADLLGYPADPELRAMVRGAGGNPRLVVDLIEGLLEEGGIDTHQGLARLVGNAVPQRVWATIGSWLTDLSEEARQLLAVSAALGRSFPLGDLAAAQRRTTRAPLSALDEVLASRLLTLTGNRLSFSHLLVRRALEENPPEHVRALRKEVEFLPEREPLSATAYPAPTCHPPFTTAYRTPVLGVADRLVPALSMARSSLRHTPHSGLLRDLHPALSYELAAAAGSRRSGRQAVAADAAASRIMALLTDDASVAREQARAVLRAGHDDAAATLAATVLSNLEWAAGNLAAGMLWGREAVRRVDSAVPVAWRPYPALALAAKLIDLGELGEAGSLIGAARKEAGRLGQGTGTADFLMVQSRLHFKAGSLPRAREQAHTAVSVATELGADWVVPEGLALLGILALRAGEQFAASDHLQRCAQEIERDPLLFAPLQYSWGKFLVASEQAAPRQAVRLLATRHLDLLARPLLFVEEPAAAAWLLRLARSAGDTALAGAVVAAIEQLALENPEHQAVGVTAVHARGLFNRDIEAVKYAIKKHTDPWAAELAWEDATALLHLPRADACAASRVQESHVGLRPDESSAGRAKADRPPKAQPERADTTARTNELTEAEHLIMRLVAEGMTNNQIARRLARSPHTINYHLRQIYRKLGINSRVALTKIFYEGSRERLDQRGDAALSTRSAAHRPPGSP